MSTAWYAAFGLLGLLSVANTVLLVATMRQVGVLHERVPPTGPGSVGPKPGRSFERLDLSPVEGATMDGLGTTPVTLLAYVTPGCSLCERIPGFLRTYVESAPIEERALLSVALATDASESEAQRFREQHEIHLPLLHHPRVRDHYGLKEVGAPYLLALADGDRADQLLLAGGIINTLEQLEDLVEMALGEYAAWAATGNTDAHAHRLNGPAKHGGARDVSQRLTDRR